MAWIFYAFFSAIAVAFATIFDRIGMRGADPTVAALIRSVIASGFLLAASIAFKKFNSTTMQLMNVKSSLFLMLGGIAIGLSWIFYLTALKHGAASKVASIDRLSIVFTVILCMVILGECFNAKVIIGSIIMAVGAYLVVA